MVIKLEPPILSWLQPRKNNCVPTELDVSIWARVWLGICMALKKFPTEGKNVRNETIIKGRRQEAAKHLVPNPFDLPVPLDKQSP